jgi:hypothetical protein
VSATELLAAAFRKVTAQLPGLRAAHREFSDTRQGQVEQALSTFEQKLYECEQTPGAQVPISALRDAMTAVATASRVARSQEVCELIGRVLTLLDARELTLAMREAAAADKAPAVEPELVGHLQIRCNGMTVGEVQALVLGVQIGRQIASPEGIREVSLPPELSTSVLTQAIEAQRARHAVLQ